MDNPSINKITTGSYYLIFDQIITYGMGAVFWILFAKIVSTTIIGQTMVVIAFSSVIIGFTGLGAEVTISKYISENRALENSAAAKKALRFGLRTGVGVSAAVGIIFALISSNIATTFYRDPSMIVLIVLAMLTYVPSQTVVSCFFGAFQGLNKMKYNALTDLVFQTVRLSVAVVLVFFSIGAIGLILSYALGSAAAVALSYFIFIRKLFASPTSVDVFPKLVGMRAFSGFNYLATGLITFAAQLGYILLGQQNFSAVALFGISYLTSGIVAAVMNSFGKAVLPAASAGAISQDRTSIKNAVGFSLKAATTLSGFIYILVIVAPSILLSSLSKDYAEAAGAMQILVVAAIVMSISGFLGYVLNGINKPGVVAKIAIISSLCNIALSFVLIPHFGLLGAAFSSLIGALAGLVLSLWQTRGYMMISYSGLYKPLLSASAAVIVGLIVISLGLTTVFFSLLLALVCYITLIAAFRVTTRSELKHMVHIAAQAAGLDRKR